MQHDIVDEPIVGTRVDRHEGVERVRVAPPNEVGAKRVGRRDEWHAGTYAVAAVLMAMPAAACGGGSEPTLPNGTTATTPTTPAAGVAPVYVTLFTHIEDNTPAGLLTSPATRTQYITLRTRLLETAALMRRYNVRWTVQPDWKYLVAALQYEDATLRATTGGLNVFRYLRDSANTAIDAHSHENGGYNYPDVAYLLDSLGVGGTTVIGGHIWDPALPQFQQWDRFRVPVRGQQFPAALWRGDLLIGSGTPNHVNDPVISGIWRPKDRNNYFDDDPAGNIAAVGAWRTNAAGVSELVARYRSGQTPATCMLTSGMNINPTTLLAPNGLSDVENTIVKPLGVMRDSGQVKFTDFTTLATTWKTEFGARACTYRVSAAR